jgi:Kelch motif protein
VNRAVASLWVAFIVVVAACGSPAPSTVPSASAIPSTAATPGSSIAAPSVSIAAATPKPSGKLAWRAMAPMPAGRDGFEATVLGDGSLLVVGDDHACSPGPAQAGSERAVVFDPVRDEWAAVQSLNKPRIQFAMVPAAGGGAMVIGGLNEQDQPFSSTKLFDPGRGTWSDGPLLDVARIDPAAAAIGDGRIVAASETKSGETSMASTAEVYAPWTGRWDEAGTIPFAIEHLLMLTDGRLLGVGAAFEVSDVMFVATPGGAEGWSPFPRPDFEDVTALVPMADGAVLAFGRGQASTGKTNGEGTARYDPRTDRWIAAAPVPTTRSEPQIGVLGDGRVVVAGGVVGGSGSGGKTIRNTEIYDPVADSWARGPDLGTSRYGGKAVTLADGSILVMGGTDQVNTEGDTPFCPGALTSVERLAPGS